MKVRMLGIVDTSQEYGINNFRDVEISKDEELSKLVGMPMIQVKEVNDTHSVLSKNIVFIKR